jgi:N-acetylglucosamine-6-phosphate deacetylase
LSVLIRNARIVGPEAILEDSELLIEDGRITRIAATIDAPHDERVLDLKGQTLFPGFIDVHIHGAVGIDLMAATGDDLMRVSEFLAGKGITSWVPTLVPGKDDEYAAAANAVQNLIEQQGSGARALGIHYEGPFVNQLQCGALHTNYFRTFSDPEQIDSLPVPANGRARMITVAPEIDGGVDLIRELTQRGWVVSIGHTRADVATLEKALAAGAKHMTHFMNAMAPLHHRAPGPIAWGLAHDDVSCDIIADGVHLDPFMLKLLSRLKGRDRLVLISDAIAAAGMGDGEYQIWGETIAVKDGRTSNAHGSIAGSVITMYDAVRMMLALGVSEIDVARMTATNPARLLKVADECGSIEVGKRADLVALDHNGDIKLTLVAGA